MPLDSGEKLGPITLAYETYGQLNADRSNAILILHALSGDAHAAGFNAATEARLVGRLHRPGQGVRHRQVFCDLLERHRRLQGLHRPQLDQSADRQALWPDFPWSPSATWCAPSIT